MSLTDFIKRRTHIVTQESEGINLAIYLINEFQDRTFTFKGLKNKYFGLSGENILKRVQEELDSMLMLYRYTTKVVGKAGMRSGYNPLDIELDIKTEMS